jgi:hypothetical protein
MMGSSQLRRSTTVSVASQHHPRRNLAPGQVTTNPGASFLWPLLTIMPPKTRTKGMAHQPVRQMYPEWIAVPVKHRTYALSGYSVKTMSRPAIDLKFGQRTA